MNIQIRPSAARGHAHHGWLESRHTFSFAGYFDPRFMGFGPLRVINEDRVRPRTGFGAHGHRNMEIVSYVVSGALSHQDSTGSSGSIRPGEVQVMSAGRGIRHSEMNHDPEAPVHFLQIWLQPRHAEGVPRYAQRPFEVREGLTLLVSPDGRDGSLSIDQDADLYRLLGDWEGALPLRGTRAWVQVVRGVVVVGEQTLHAGDGAAITELSSLSLAGRSAEALIFDLP